MLGYVLFSSVLALTAPALADFGVTTTTSTYTVDTADTDGFTVDISRSTCDITSIKYRGSEYQYSSQKSHIASSLESATVSYSVISSNYIKVTCVAKNSDFDLTQYLVFKNGESNIYMATDTNAEPAVGELRFIARLDSSKLPSEYPFGTASNIAGGTSVEGEDVFLVDGQTRSKFYSSERHIDDTVHCVYASDSSVHACMVLNDYSYEKSSGGPFHRDINTNNVGSYIGLYFYMNSNHVQTESYRQGFHGPYTLAFTRSGIPKSSEIDTSFFSSLSISSYTAASGRGVVTGTASGVSSTFPIVVHWYNDNYQYWAYASSSGSFTSPSMMPGTYAMKLYQDEFLAATTTGVSVTAGSTKTQNIAATSTVITSSHTTIFKIGDYDGQPTGFLNADKQLRMHPSDTRMSSWAPVTYTVGSSSVGDFPMALFKDVNNPVTIKFSLSSAINKAATLRIATTLAFSNGRPQPAINSYTATAPAAPTKIDSRGVTRGAYRGYGEIYEFSIPSGTLVSGSNTVTISVISGNTGDDFLSPNFIFDAVELFY